MAYSCVCHFFCVTLQRKVRTCMRKWVLFIGLLLAMAVNAAGYTPASVPNPRLTGTALYVANPDNILANDDVAFLENCASKLNDATHVEMVVVALNAIYNTDAFQFAYELFQRWGIGRKGQNTGVLILFVLDSHDIRIITGTGMEGVLTDAQCAAIIREDMTPYFKAGDYGGGLCRGALHIYQTCTKGDAPEELLNMKSVTNRGGFDSEASDPALPWIAFILLTVLLVFVIWLIWKTKDDDSDKRSGGHHGGGYYGALFGGGFSGGGFSGGGFSGGFGGGSTMGGGAGGKW